jgi:hypothetical protein
MGLGVALLAWLRRFAGTKGRGMVNAAYLLVRPRAGGAG